MGAFSDQYQDRVGIGWRPEISADLLIHQDEVDCLEVVIESLLHLPRPTREALKWLGSQLPIDYHGVALGLASSHPVDSGALEKVARLLRESGARSWSEHLAFVRAGGHEIGHLAMPPRTWATIEGLAKNMEIVKSRVGSAPLLENIATLIEPPGAELPEPEWVSAALKACDGGLLLDLHNLYANALNRGENPLSYLLRFPLERVRTVHLSGGKWIPEPQGTGRYRLLDDHVHDVPVELYLLLEEVAARVRRSLRVIIERDGEYPDFSVLLDQVARARRALASGRKRLWIVDSRSDCSFTPGMEVQS